MIKVVYGENEFEFQSTTELWEEFISGFNEQDGIWILLSSDQLEYLKKIPAPFEIQQVDLTAKDLVQELIRVMDLPYLYVTYATNDERIQLDSLLKMRLDAFGQGNYCDLIIN